MTSIMPLRTALGAVAFAALLALHTAGAAARDAELTQMSASPIPTATPVVAIESPPPSVGVAAAAGTCANDDFLAWRSVPAPLVRTVTVCGTVVALPPDATRGGPSASFALDVDGTRAVPIVTDGAFAAKPGDALLVRGRYERAKSGGDWIDHAQPVASAAYSQPASVITNNATHP